MISHVLSSIEGVAFYPIFSLLIFVPFFILVTLKVLRMDKTHAQKMSQLPLDNSYYETETK